MIPEEKADLRREVNQSLEHVLAVHVAVLVDVQINHEARMSGDLGQGLK